MSRNTYDEAFGVAPLDWHEGRPPRESGLVLVEVWKSHLNNVDPSFSTATAQAVVFANVEVRCYAAGSWRKVEWNGELVALDDRAEVRRWANLPTRRWTSNITLDGWDRL